MNQQIFQEVLEDVRTLYEPIAKLHGKQLTMKGEWENLDVLGTSQVGSIDWEIRVSGALARHPAITRDALTLVTCHEVGHQLGGYPFKVDSFEPSDRIHSESAEAQADYFATHACTKKVWKAQKEVNAQFRELVDEGQKLKCDSVWNTIPEQNLCYRSLMAIESVAYFLSDLFGSQGVKPVRIDTPDTKVTKWPILDEGEYPSAQCRIDTFVAGALCTKEWSDSIKPGLGHPKGQQSPEAEAEAAQYSCFARDGFTQGARPLCWYLPRR